MAKKNFYAVKEGRTPGIYKSWDEAKKEIDGFSGAIYKGFVTLKEANDFMGNSEQFEQLSFDNNLSVCGLEAYVDGSYSVELSNYSYGVVIIDNETVTTLNGVGKDSEAAKMRNVAGELQGAMVAMDYAIKNNYPSITIYHDYEGIARWAKNEWKANLISTQKYKEFYNSIKDKLAVTFVKVAAHTGVTYNELADKLAKEALGI